MDTLPVGKESGQASEQGDTQQPRPPPRPVLRGGRGKKGSYEGGQEKKVQGKGQGYSGERGPEAHKGQEAERKGCSTTA